MPAGFSTQTEAPIEVWEVLALLAAGTLAGAVNTLVGGGTSIVLPLLFFMGVPPQIANGTNRLAICFQGLAALGTLKRGLAKSDRSVGVRELAPPALASLLGAIPGSLLAARMDAQAFRVVVAWLLLGAIVFFFWKPTIPKDAEASRRPWAGWSVAFLLGAYGGFLGAGVGVLILVFLTPLLRLDLVRMVPVKVAMVFLLSFSASVIYVAEGQVWWSYALPLVVANVIGGILGAKIALWGGEVWIRRGIAVVAAVLAALILWQNRS